MAGLLASWVQLASIRRKIQHFWKMKHEKIVSMIPVYTFWNKHHMKALVFLTYFPSCVPHYSFPLNILPYLIHVKNDVTVNSHYQYPSIYIFTAG
ncbi:hypothetical protein BRADI_2g19965v3 [Brachypodium distachyon]|uniref:Uncharacterized protein n=1 Tax=Brachypodium distachyon TaxID=15368 RepID=A0A0Q3K3Q5_BRADI|nr:hypothetical protein BRADI_2g19965v3 [Brachypodium distachyon]